MQEAVFITGASSGIGEALARAYAERGAVLGLVGRRRAALETLLAGLPNPHLHHVYVLDVNDHTGLQGAAQDFLSRVEYVHTVIASAGISVGTLTEEMSDLAVFNQVMQTNLIATVATFAPFIPTMKAYPASVPRRLVGIASVAGIRGLPGAGAYSASKAAVISYCESLRVELKDSDIQVVTIAPGYIDTPMTQVNDYAMPFLMPVDDFAQATLKAIDRGSSYRVIPWQMGVVAKLLRALPNFLYDFAFNRAPRKARLIK